MFDIQLTYIRWLFVIPALLLINACGDGNSISSNEGSATSDKGKWLEAANALQVVQVGARNEALLARIDPPDTSCEALLPETEKKLQNPSSVPSLFKVITDPCTNAGLEYGERIRCESGRLQVLCL